jgi:MFS family permease
MYFQSHTFNKMEEARTSTSRSQEFEKQDGSVVEMGSMAATPLNDQDNQKLAPVDSKGSRGPVVHEKMNFRLFMVLLCMSFLWIGCQIPLFLFGSILTLIYKDIGGADRYSWFMIAYLIANAALCPFVGALSDLFGKQKVAIMGQASLVIGAIIVSLAPNMNVAIGGQVFSGIGAGINELIALAGTAEVVPVKDRGKYIGAVVFTLIPFCPSVLYAQYIASDGGSWRYNGIFVGVWNFVGLLLCIFFYRSPSRLSEDYTARDVLRKIDFIGGALSITGVTLFMMGLQWGAVQYNWGSVHNLVPLLLGLALLAAFVVWELRAPYPMVPRAMFSKAKKTMIVILLLIFISGGTFFALILIYPSQVFNVWGDDPVKVGLRSLPIGFGIMIGAVIGLALIPLSKGRMREIMIFFTALMTATTGALAVATPHNLTTVLVLVSIACTAVGAVVIPSTIIAQIACPPDLIATVTALTLSIRYIGGAVGFSIYIATFSKEATKYLTEMATNTIAMGAIVNPLIPAGRAAIDFCCLLSEV